ncbi:CheR family methyltransferase [Roseivivax sediminis]|uniref:histidine kinase n=1 Tax=Roseivivax sediminis TaxID=936889 RepID=A0A1I1VKM0_9RHOB|nr:CheR family methyltransferase [Roseivivax sediminis]SFD83471.1 two-component system, chemotaxis family, CheB/CheR fusion protein [Roseivivax sediminis]
MTTGQELTVVGIGASAGGIEALETFFRNLGAPRNMALVVVTHLNPDHESRLHEVLGRHADIEVRAAEDGATLSAGQVHVMPEACVIRLRDGRIALDRVTRPEAREKPIDIFFSSLARDRGDRAVGIVLSGSDADGTLGIKAIKESGGITMAQAPDGGRGPGHADMPRSAIATGLVDFELTVESMPETLRRLVDSRTSFEALADTWDDGALDTEMQTAFDLLRSHTGHDFSGYKKRTFLRRMSRRAQIVEASTLTDYIRHLRNAPTEVMELYRDLLINVTRFFRDADAFAALEENVIPQLFQGRTSGDVVRVWVPGCATGEEVYSIAILLREEMERHPGGPHAQIFATDIDEPALDVARAGRYPEEFVSSIDPARRDRAFRREGTQYIVRKEVRDLCIFSPHSVISDPPFARMDLLSCRNLLIYFGRDLQDQVIPTFHYALKPGGYLFLGTSESISRQDALFAPVDRQQRIFRSRETTTSHPGVPNAFRGGAEGLGKLHIGRSQPSPSRSSFQLRQRVEMQVLDRHAPPHVVVDRHGEIVYYSARVGRFLEIPRGAPNRRLLDMTPRQLRQELNTVLREAMESGLPAHRNAVHVSDEDGQDTELRLTVEPIHMERGAETVYLTLFVPTGRRGASDSRSDASGHDEDTYETELRELRERMHSTIEEYETALEELKSSNEELVSANEEAQSANEELEASKEEMQTLNEELSSTNAVLSSKLEELDRAHDDMRNLYEATQIASVFLDTDLVIRNFTPAALTFFHLRRNDVGRPLSDLALTLDYPEFRERLQEVLSSGEMIEDRVRPKDDARRFVVRLVPYRDKNNGIDGVVVTLIDMTSLARAEENQRLLIDELNHRVKNILTVVISVVNATLRSTRDPDAFGAALNDRLHGMARTYKLLSQEEWREISLHALIEQECHAHDPARFAIEGPDLSLSSRKSLPVGLAIHELATNAAKYGALTCDTGCVHIRWSVTDDIVRIDWRETGGPATSEPEADGFGWQLIEGQVCQQLRGELEREFRPEGLQVSIRFSRKDPQDVWS